MVARCSKVYVRRTKATAAEMRSSAETTTGGATEVTATPKSSSMTATKTTTAETASTPAVASCPTGVS